MCKNRSLSQYLILILISCRKRETKSFLTLRKDVVFWFGTTSTSEFFLHKGKSYLSHPSIIDIYESSHFHFFTKEKLYRVEEAYREDAWGVPTSSFFNGIERFWRSRLFISRSREKPCNEQKQTNITSVTLWRLFIDKLPGFQQPAKPPPQIYLSKGINFHTLKKVIILISSVFKSAWRVVQLY